MNIRDFPASIRPDKCFPYLQEPPVSSLVYEDDSRDYNLDGTCPQQFFKLSFFSIDTDGADTLDAHYNEAQGSGHTFNFTDPFTGYVYNNMRYVDYEHGEHTKTWMPVRVITIAQDI